MTREWQAYVLEDDSFFDFAHGMVVLDVGCGDGEELLHLQRSGCIGAGIDTSPYCVARCRDLGLRIVQARAEDMPVRTGSLDAVVCKVVVPYTDEARVLAEIGRVLRHGGKGFLCYHGIGYYLRYLLIGHFKHRLYALRALVNTWLYATTRKRLPGFVGDTLYQSRRRLARYYRDSGLVPVQECPARRFLGLPVFIYDALEKTS